MLNDDSFPYVLPVCATFVPHENFEKIDRTVGADAADAADAAGGEDFVSTLEDVVVVVKRNRCQGSPSARSAESYDCNDSGCTAQRAYLQA